MALALALMSVVPSGAATRLKDLAAWEGVRDNQLVGYGLVVGLAGTGDKRQTIFSAQTLTNILQRMGVVVSSSAIQVRNVAAVMVTSSLPAYAQPGARIDVTAAAIGDATNLQGGLLVLTPLKGVDGQVYAVAQGPVVTGGFVAGRGGSSQTLNHPTVGRLPGGATVEKPSPSPTLGPKLRLQLRQADFTTSARVAEAVNRKFPMSVPVARAENAALVAIDTPASYQANTTEFIAAIENLTLDADRAARIVINERTGTIVMGKQARIAPVAVMHGALTVEVQTAYAVSQPAPFSKGTTEVVPQVAVSAKEEKAKNLVLKEGATVEELVRALASIGATPRDIIAILQNLRSAGAVEAELEVI
ncbi:MAG: flagellar basal body P-ring protein FlgI [Bryobacteraceae bacterium]